MTRGADKAAVAWAAIDLLGCLFLVVLVLAQPPLKKQPPHIATDGQYAVTIEWADKSPNDVDLYVEDPEDNICYFVNDRVGLMNLENDDLGLSSDTQGKKQLYTNHERVILRGFVQGEYVVNAHMYQRNGGAGRERVTVRLYRLRGDDTLVKTKVIYLGAEGDEQTAFRFTLDANGDITAYSSLPKALVSTANMSPGSPGGDGGATGYSGYDPHYGNGTSGP